jgi:hypothetical protein
VQSEPTQTIDQLFATLRGEHPTPLSPGLWPELPQPRRIEARPKMIDIAGLRDDEQEIDRHDGGLA